MNEFRCAVRQHMYGAVLLCILFAAVSLSASVLCIPAYGDTSVNGSTSVSDNTSAGSEQTNTVIEANTDEAANADSSASPSEISSDNPPAESDDEFASSSDELEEEPGFIDLSDVDASMSKIRGGVRKLKAKAEDGAPLYVMIGDSYGIVKPRLAKTIAQELGLSAVGGNYYAYFRGGYGAARKNGKNFMTLLKLLPSNKKVTDVLFYGGITNDRNYSKETIQDAIAKLAEKARKKYPNARIMYAIGNWHYNGQSKKAKASARVYQKRILERIKWYKEACKKNDIYFLKGVEKTLRDKNNKAYFKKDWHHPSRTGVQKLAKAIAKSIKRLNKYTKVRSVSLKTSTLSLQVGASEKLEAKVKAKKYCVTKKVVFTSDNTSVCTVDAESGTVKAVGAGKCNIYCRAFDGSGASAVCTVTVN